MRESRIRLLVLYANYTDQMSYFDDWPDALREHRGFDTTLVDIISSGARGRIKRAVGEVDAVVHVIRSFEDPDVVHVMAKGKIVKSGGKELALELEAKGYAQFSGEAA